MQKISFRRRALLSLVATTSLSFAATASAQSISTLMFFDGTTPQGGLVLGSDGALYGTGSESSYSASAAGLYFRLAADGSSVTTIYQYGSLGQFVGGGPRATLLRASDGNFYGTTTYNSVDLLRGTRSGTGTIFRMSQDGKTYTKLFEFQPLTEDSRGFAVNDSGAVPLVRLTEGDEGGVKYLYGASATGGQNGTGTIFKIRTDGSGFQVLHHFGEAIRKQGVDQNGQPTLVFDTNSDGRLRNPDGVNPGLVLATFDGSMVTVDVPLTIAPNGRLYGTTHNGGVNGTGVVFSLQVDGADFRATPFDVSPATISSTDTSNPNFGLPKTNTTGAYPGSNLILASDNRLYGTATSHGGFTGPAGQGGYGGGFGTIYRIDPAANPIVIESVLAFTGTANPAPGASPMGHLIVGSDGQLVGTVAGGGIRDATTTPVTAGAGAIFKFNPVNSAYSTPFVFGADNQNVYDYGAAPNRGVIEVAEGSGVAYYGVASQGGPYRIGSVFKFGAPVNRDEPLGTPQDYDDGGGALGLWMLLGLALLAAMLGARRHRRRDVAR